jgi:hypothetical protein
MKKATDDCIAKVREHILQCFYAFSLDLYSHDNIIALLPHFSPRQLILWDRSCLVANCLASFSVSLKFRL